MRFHDEVTRFYRRWHALERALGPKGGLVLDFDFAPGSGPVEPFPDRAAALRAVTALREALPSGLRDPELVDAKLEGAETYLRALMGERLPFDEHLWRTMRLRPERRAGALAALREELVEAFGERGIRFDTRGRHAFALRFGSVGGSEVGPELRRHAARYVERARAFVGDLPDPEYRVEVVTEDAYWSNWIDGCHAAGVRLRINTHGRIEYNRHSAEALAAHEIGGHALQVAALLREARDGRLDPCLLNLSVHSCEAFHMEGLAQVALLVLSGADERDPDLVLLERYRDYVSGLLNEAQLDVEEGAPLDQAVSAVVRACPLLRRSSVRSNLRDRRRDPLYRSYIHVYPPSKALFLRALELPEPARRAFFREAWTGLRMPEVLAARVRAAA